MLCVGIALHFPQMRSALCSISTSMPHMLPTREYSTSRHMALLWPLQYQSLWQLWSWRMWSSGHSKSLFWKRSVDETCTALQLDQVEAFHLHLNPIEPTIQFTIGRQMGVFYSWTPRSPATRMAPCLQKCTTREHAQINILTLSPTIPWHTSCQWSLFCWADTLCSSVMDQDYDVI